MDFVDGLMEATINLLQQAVKSGVKNAASSSSSSSSYHLKKIAKDDILNAAALHDELWRVTEFDDVEKKRREAKLEISYGREGLDAIRSKGYLKRRPNDTERVFRKRQEERIRTISLCRRYFNIPLFSTHEKEELLLGIPTIPPAVTTMRRPTTTTTAPMMMHGGIPQRQLEQQQRQLPSDNVEIDHDEGGEEDQGDDHGAACSVASETRSFSPLPTSAADNPNTAATNGVEPLFLAKSFPDDNKEKEHKLIGRGGGGGKGGGGKHCQGRSDSNSVPANISHSNEARGSSIEPLFLLGHQDRHHRGRRRHDEQAQEEQSSVSSSHVKKRRRKSIAKVMATIDAKISGDGTHTIEPLFLSHKNSVNLNELPYKKSSSAIQQECEGLASSSRVAGTRARSDGAGETATRLVEPLFLLPPGD
mmetsp:Transcript_4791/g.7773  ORF Transcript_4791/g.7773 Transcript_4791/m.7773 type:complete len:419 (+) Transcript_4791:308-1564(+)